MKLIGAICASGFVLCIIFGVCALIGALLWPYTINSWLVFAHREPVVAWYHGALLGFCPVIGQLTIPAAVATWILMLILGG
jgi:hypothetical protein